MAPPKKNVLKALGDPHLRAIGLVAAQWSALEISLIWVISKEFNLKLTQAVILAGAQNATAWCEMLRKEANPRTVEGTKRKRTEIDLISIEVADLLKLRNDIVHTDWHSSRTPIIAGAVGALTLAHYANLEKRRFKANEVVQGAAIPKRGSKIFNFTALTAKEMLTVATRIEAVEQRIFSWGVRDRLKSKLVDALRNP